jgi:hypothetical protein
MNVWAYSYKTFYRKLEALHNELEVKSKEACYYDRDYWYMEGSLFVKDKIKTILDEHKPE